MDELPTYISPVFVATTLTTLGFIYFGLRSVEGKGNHTISSVVLVGLGAWMLITGYLAYSGAILNFTSMPPRLIFIVLPPNLLVFGLLLMKRSRDFLMQIPITTLTYLHIVRVPVEIVLWWLSFSTLLPALLTFEGINHDILSGVTAPLVAIFLVGRKRKNKIGAIAWNIAAMALLVNIVVHAILSTPYPFQQFSLDEPMTAVFCLPYIWLPAFIVPAVLFAHLTSLVQLLAKE